VLDVGFRGGDRLSTTARLRRAARNGKGAFLLASFKEVYESIGPDCGSISEAFHDAAYYKYAAVPCFCIVHWI
jgi:hypothetical protein